MKGHGRVRSSNKGCGTDEGGERVRAAFLAVLAGIFMPLLVWVAAIAALWHIFVEWQAIRPDERYPSTWLFHELYQAGSGS